MCHIKFDQHLMSQLSAFFAQGKDRHMQLCMVDGSYMEVHPKGGNCDWVNRVFHKPKSHIGAKSRAVWLMSL